MKIGIANDHRGVELKDYLLEKLQEYEVVNLGTDTNESVDYPDFAFLLGEKVANHELDYGIAICGSGIGISIACNKVKGIRCAKVSNIDEARYTRIDNDANIVALSANTNQEDALKIVETFLNTDFSHEERHQKRIDKITKYERGEYER
ncbi:MAG: RpiB/LacA/LacB family sugar-phosphate isomerase [Bacilli bacterium]|nr:RpiB/LacA/LacB family sugar-phosphate isomerase [Bacilli bacterium]